MLSLFLFIPQKELFPTDEIMEMPPPIHAPDRVNTDGPSVAPILHKRNVQFFSVHFPQYRSREKKKFFFPFFRDLPLNLHKTLGMTQTDTSIRAVKGLGIAAANRTESVILFSRKPLDRIQTVLTDAASLTSIVLLQIILKEKYACEAKLRPGPIHDIHQAMKDYDGVLAIGDEAILAEKTDYDHYDLASEWFSLTGLPFVFAVWACNRPLEDAEVERLQQSYRESTLHWDQIYHRAASMLPVDIRFLKRYYNVNLHYQLTRSDYEGLLKFLAFADRLRYVDRIRKDIWL